MGYILIGFGTGFGHDKEVFLFFFHAVLLTGEFFELFGAGQQFVLVLAGAVYFLAVKGLLAFQLVHFCIELVLGEDIMAVQEKQPDKEEYPANDVFVAEESRHPESLLHFHIKPVGGRYPGTGRPAPGMICIDH